MKKNKCLIMITLIILTLTPALYTQTLPVSKIIIAEVDVEQTEPQFTIDQGLSSFTLSCEGVANPEFTIATNNNRVISATLDRTILTITSIKAGRASLRIKETGNGEIRYVGVRVKTKSGKLPGMPEYVAIGSVSEDTANDLNFWKDFYDDDRNKQVDIRYVYLNGGPISGWKNWSGQPGGRAINYIINSKQLGIIPYFVYYNIPDSDESYAIDRAHMQDSTYMSAYYQDLKFLLDLCNEYAGDEIVGLIFEPDFIGYMMQKSGQQPEELSAAVGAAYSSGVLGAGDPTFPNTLEGLVKSINYIVDKYGNNIHFGWQLNLWAKSGVSNKGVIRVTDTAGMIEGRKIVKQVAGEITDYYLRAGIMSYGADFLSIDKYGLDGAANGTPNDPEQSIWFWNADHWNNYLLFCNEMHVRSEAPVLLWQIPVGHVNVSQAPDPYNGGIFTPLDNTGQRYEDSAPTFFFGDTFKPGEGKRWNWFTRNESNDTGVIDDGIDTIVWESHMRAARDCGITGILYGAGVAGSTDGVGYPPTDHYWWITKTQRYLQNPVPLVEYPATPTPTATPTLINIAVNRPVGISGSYAPQFGGEKAVDGNRTTPWGSAVDTKAQWIYVDLGSVTEINGLGLYWFQDYYAREYTIYVSNDAKQWTDLVTITKYQGGDDVFTDNISFKTRYLALLFNKKNKAAIGLNELEIYQLRLPPTPTVTPSPTFTPTPTPLYPLWTHPYNYKVGDRVLYYGVAWECISAHESNAAWSPLQTEDIFWKRLSTR